MKTWREVLTKEKEKDYYKILQKKLKIKSLEARVFPEKSKMFDAFVYTPLDKIQVVILGQDPYHKFEQADGLSFSTPIHIKNPPSMLNILKEIQSDLNQQSSCSKGDLHSWAKDGVLLLNTILSVQEGKAKSHHNIGWETFTNNIISYISSNCENIIFLLWGASAISKEVLINASNHYILKSVHPSPLSAYRGFFGSKHFSKTNDILKSLGKKAITW